MARSNPKRGAAFYRGDAGRQKAEEELARQKAAAEARKEQGNMPFRFRVGVGDTTQFVVLDDIPDFYRFEHNLKNLKTGFWDTYTGCIKEWDNCPVCDVAERESYYAMYLSVLDLTPFKTRDGEKHEFSRKLLVVKPAQQKKFQRAYAKAEKDGRTLRGAIFEVTRDGEKDSAIGNDIELIEFMEEDELATYTRSWKDKDGKKHTEDCSEPFDYEKLFQEPDAESLRAIVGGSPTPGSRAHEERELGGRSSSRSRRRADEDDDGDGDYEPADRKSRMKSERSAPKGRGRGRDDDADDDADDDGDDTSSSRRPSRKGRDEKPARTTGRRSSRDDDADGDDEDDGDAEDTRTTRRSSRDEKPARSSTRSRRGSEDDDPPFDTDGDGDDDGDDRGGRKAPGVGRRVSARGRR